MKSFKQDRIRQILIEEINSMIVLKKISDPKVSSRVSVVHAKVSRDANSATIYVSSFHDEKSLQNTVQALNHAKGFIQLEINKKHKWKFTPKLLFKASAGLFQGQRVLESIEAMYGLDSIPSTTHENSNLNK